MQGPDGLSQGRVQVDCYALSYSATAEIARVVVAELHGHRDDKFRLIAHDATRTSREGGANEADRPFRHSLDFLVSWRQNNGAE